MGNEHSTTGSKKSKNGSSGFICGGPSNSRRQQGKTQHKNVIQKDRNLDSYLIESNKKNGLMMSSLMHPDGDQSMPQSRTTSNFDTHVQMHNQREKFFDKLGLNAESAMNDPARAESRRVSRGLSTFDFQFQQGIATTRESQRAARPTQASSSMGLSQIQERQTFKTPTQKTSGLIMSKITVGTNPNKDESVVEANCDFQFTSEKIEDNTAPLDLDKPNISKRGTNEHLEGRSDLTTTAEANQSITKIPAIEIAFGKIQGIVEELKDDPALKLNPLPMMNTENEGDQTLSQLQKTETTSPDMNDEDSPQIIVQEGEDDEEEEHINVLNQDRSYMLSYILQKQKDEEAPENFKRTSERIRTQFLSKLVYQNVWGSPQKRPKTHQTCVIFDWDDTLLCTSFLTPYPSMLMDPRQQIPRDMIEPLELLDKSGYQLLRHAKQLAPKMTFIITNAAEGWVEMSAKRFLPRVCQEIQKDITIISARTKFEKLYPHDYQEWKIRAFLEAQALLEQDAITNLVAIGDNNIEIEAAYHLASQFSNAFIKTIKFREGPSIQELTKQLKLVSNQFQQIVTAAKNLTVRLQKFGKGAATDEEVAENERIQRQRRLFIQKQKQTRDGEGQQRLVRSNSMETLREGLEIEKPEKTLNHQNSSSKVFDGIGVDSNFMSKIRRRLSVDARKPQGDEEVKVKA